MPNKEFLQKMQERLVDERGRLEEEKIAAEEQHADVEDEDELAIGEEIAEVNHDIAAQLEEDIRKIDAAIKRIVAGTYGTCQVGGEPIPESRLEILPWAENCIEHEPV